MRYLVCVAGVCLCFNMASAQTTKTAIPTHYIEPIKWRHGKVETPAYIDSSLFATYINWNLQPDSIPTSIKPEKGYAIEIMYVVSREGKISQAESRTKENAALTNFISQKLMSCPYQWAPAYQNGRAVNSYIRLKIVF